MTPLSDQQKQLLFDYSMGLTSSRQTTEAQRLLSRNQEAVELYRTFQNILAPLESMELDPCPEELTERLLARLKEAAQESREVSRLGELLAAERSGPRTIKIPLWRNWGEIVTAAAAEADIGADRAEHTSKGVGTFPGRGEGTNRPAAGPADAAVVAVF